MPIYNGEAFLREAIDSLLVQTNDNWRLMCINDESTDSSVDIVRSYMEKDSRIKLLQQQNSGPGVARAYAIENLQTDYCAILDADDLLEPTYVETISARIEETGADIVTPEAQYITEEGEMRERHFEEIGMSLDLIIDGGEEAFSLTLPWKLHGWQVMSSELAKKYYTRDGVSYSRFNSDEYITRLIYLKSKKVALSHAKYIHRINPSSITQKVSLKRMDYLVTFYKILELIENEHLSVKIKKSVFDEFLIEIVTLKQMCKWLPIADRTIAERMIKEYYYKFRSHFTLGMLLHTPLKAAIKYLISMSSYLAIELFAYSRDLRQK